MEVRCGLAFGERLRDNDVDGAAVFGVDATERVEFGGLLHHAKHQLIVNHEHVRIGHEEFEAGDAELHHLFHLAKCLFSVFAVEVGDGHVQREVDTGFVFGFLQPGFERVLERAGLVLQREVDDGRCATNGCGLRSGCVVIGRSRAAEGHVEVRVNVNATGHYEEIGRVDDVVIRFRDVGGDLRDLLAFDEDVGALRACGVDDGSVLDQRSHSFSTSSQRLRRLGSGASALRLEARCLRQRARPNSEVQGHCRRAPW